MSIPISLGSGAASIATTGIGGAEYQNVIVISSVAVVAPAGSIMAVSGAVTMVAGSVATVVNPAGSITGISGSVTAPAGSVMAVSFAASANQSVSGAITAPPGSVMTVATLAGSIMAVSGTVTNPAGSIATVVNPAGSVTGTYWGLTPSIVGTYAEDAAHTTADKGQFVLAVRNDTLASITSADSDYSPIAVDPSGAVTVHDAPITKWVQGTADLRVVLGTSVAVLAAQGASVFTYIREIQVANMGSASVLVTFAGGLGSILGYTIAPAGGGSNYLTRLKTGENSAFTASISGTASVLVTATGFIAKI